MTPADPEEARFPAWLDHPVGLVGLFVAYAVLAQASQALVFPAVGHAVFWLPSGLIFGLIVRARATPRRWPWLLAAVTLAYQCVNVLAGVRPALAAGWCVANALVPISAAVLARRWVTGPFALGRIRDVLTLAVLIVLTAIPGAIVAGAVASVGLGKPFLVFALGWGVSDALGVALLAPVVLAWTAPQPPIEGGRREGLALLAVGAGLATLVLLRPAPAESLDPSLPSFLLFVAAWAAVRFGPRATTVALLALDLALVAGVAAGAGPFSNWAAPPADRLLNLQVLVANGGLLLLVLGAAIEAQRRAKATANASRAEAERTAAENARLYAQVREALGEREALVAARTAELRAANEELEAFTYSASHDLRAPLRAIDGFAQALEEDCGLALAGSGASHLARIRAGSQRMDALIASLLELSRVARADVTRVDVDLSKLARELWDDLARVEPARDVKLEVAPGLTARADLGLVRVVLDNLLANAWKFTARRSGARVEVGVKAGASEPAFFVKDDGVGFDPCQAARLFHAYQRLHPADEFPGTGIGLATVKRAVQRHGGAVWAEAAPGQGACFWFTLAT